MEAKFMKKLVFAAIFVVFLAAGLPVFAQDQPRPNSTDDRESEYYYVNVTLEKIFPYTKGYVVEYRKSFGQYGRIYLPAEWFTDASSRGEILTLPSGQAWPSLTVYYRNGSFSHVRLYVHRWASHPSWGNIPLGVNIDDQFKNIENVIIQY
jgi:hypothetical protein